MGSRLYVEVLDYAPTTLTHREKLFLAVLADDARDTTRITWSSVESPKNLRRGKVTRPQVYELIKALVKKGCLEKVSAGQKHGTAKYRLLPLQCPEIPDVEDADQGPDSADTDDASQPPDSPDTETQCPENPDTDQPQRPDSADTEPDSQCPENPDTDESQCPENPDVSVRKSRTPTLSPLSTRPLSFGEPSVTADPQAAPDDVVDGEILEEAAAEKPETVTAQTIVGQWLERCTDRPPTRVIGQVSKEIKALLDDGIHPNWIRHGLQRWMDRGLHPATIPSVVNEVMNSGPRRSTTGSPQPAGETVFDRARARAAARTAARQEGATP